MDDKPPQNKGCLASVLGFLVLALIIAGPRLLRAIESSSNASQMRASIDELIKGPSIQEVTVVRHYVNGIGIANEPHPISVDFIGAQMCTECPAWNDRFRDSAISEVRRLTTGRVVKIEFDVERTSPMVGNWPDVLAYVWANDILVNAEMVRLGYLIVGDFGQNTKYRETLLEAEREAKDVGIGIWSQPLIQAPEQ